MNRLAAIAWSIATALVCAQPAEAAPKLPVDFNRDIRPILSDRCFACHGPDEAARKAKLRLDSHDEAVKKAIVPGNAVKSELIIRITSKDEDEIMPPPKAKKPLLSQAEVDLFKRWIDDGAKYASHWAYEKPVRAPIPKIRNPQFAIRNPLDSFILARLEKEGLKPSPEADRAVLCRRVFLDLIGLPPSPAQVDEFLADTSERAYERLVDRLLAAPQYGEKWARPWLDLARYADSNGFQRDGFRDLWAYRDWVVRALNADMPFDRFTIEQLAGDLLPNATAEQKIATGFHRCTTVNVEAGTDQEENRANQVIDRVNTTATVWLGSTLECAQCHDHKYDPFTQRDYYRLFAFFNNTAIETKFRTEKATAAVDFTGPAMDLAGSDFEKQKASLQAEVERLAEAIASRKEVLTKSGKRTASESGSTANKAGEWQVLDIAEFQSSGGATGKILDDRSVLVGGKAPDKDTYTITVHTKLTGISAIKLEALTDPSLPGEGPGRGAADRPNFVLNTFGLVEAPESDPNTGRPVLFSSAQADFSQAKYDVAGAIDSDPKTGWAINPQFHKPHWAMFVAEQSFGSEDGSVLTFTLEQNLGASRSVGRLRLSALTGDARAALGASPADPESKRLQDEHAKALQKLKALAPPQTLVMQELAEPRMTTVFKRGNFLDKGEPVQAGTPAFLHSLKSPSEKTTRLDLARWLVSKDNPLVARVTVNRWWAEFFGHGLVTTPEDFGAKGEPPSHPEFVDWLAVEFMERGWSMKHIHKLIVMSATYRQSSKVTPELLARDDQNRLYARGPRFRLDAETIRDNALAAAGLLSLKQGGPPVRPFQPDGVWTVTGLVDNNYRLSDGDDRYRRGLYVVWRRSALYPSFMNFDATVRGQCTVKRSRSNTPLQALTLLNDPVYVEAAEALARRVLREKPRASVEERLTHAFRLCLARQPTANELTTLQRLVESELAAKRPEAAVWQAVATAVLNLDETITKG